MPKGQKGFAQVLLILLLLAGLGAGLYLSQQTQIFKPKAAPSLPANPEASFELELEKSGELPFLDEATPTNLTPNQKFRVDVYARSDIDAANLFTAKIKYSSDTVELIEVNKRDGQSFVRNWVESSNEGGVVSLVGGVANPGIKTDSKSGALLMGSIIFKAKASGTINIEAIPTSAIYRNSDNTNILTTGKGLIQNVAIQEPQPTPTPAPLSCSGVIVAGAATEGKLASGEKVYTVESEGKVKMAAEVTPIDTKMEWKEVSKSTGLPAGTFETGGSTTTYYTLPKNSGTQDGTVDVVASVVREAIISGGVIGDPQPISCPTVHFVVKPISQTTPTPTPSSATYTWHGTNLDATTICSNLDVTKFNVTLLGNVTTQTNGNGIWTTLTGNGNTIITSYQAGSSTNIAANYTNGQVPPIRGGNPIMLLTSGPTNTYGYTFKAYSAPFTDGSPNFIGAPVLGQVDFATDCNKILFSPTPTPTPTLTPGDGDGNKDGRVDLIDLSVLLSDYNKNGGFRTGIDLNGDGAVNAFDFGLMRNLLIQKGVIKGS